MSAACRLVAARYRIQGRLSRQNSGQFTEESAAEVTAFVNAEIAAGGRGRCRSGRGLLRWHVSTDRLGARADGDVSHSG